ncbi:MAG: hypothetical protein ACYCXQ_09270 [Candidatus Humimicrobiaceae bacterium]
MRDDVLHWLLNSDPWVEYAARVDLMEQEENNGEVISARKRMLQSDTLRKILEELENWPGCVLNSHKSASQPFHKISFIAELGFKIGDANIYEISMKMLKHVSEEGIIKLPMNISKAYGGTGSEIWAWALCDAPTNLYALAKIGFKQDERIINGVKYLSKLIRDNGWPCVVSKELGNFRGPGRKDDPCPYATLIMLKLLSEFREYVDSREVHTGIETLCNLWDHSKESHPYIFYMGNDFRKLKAPLVWYDLLHVLDVLSRFPYSKGKKQVREMSEILLSKQDTEGKYTPESVWQEWKGWDFGQKKEPSPYLTYLAYRVLKRLVIPT